MIESFPRMWIFFRVQRTLIRRYPQRNILLRYKTKKNFFPLLSKYYFLDEIFSNQVSPMKIISNNWIVFTRLINKKKEIIIITMLGLSFKIKK